MTDWWLGAALGSGMLRAEVLLACLIALLIVLRHPYVLGILMMPDALRPWERSDEEDDESGLTVPAW